jgi:hypothetical protein
MNCRDAERRLAGYLDGAINSRDHARVREHLDSCGGCREQLESYRRLAISLARVEAVAPPADLAARIRVDASHPQSFAPVLTRAWARAAIVFHNLLQPMAIPAAGGVLTALVVFVLVVQNILVGVPLGGVAPNDLPLNLVQPARLESLAPFPAPGVIERNGQAGALLLEATLNAQGQVVSYQILSGPNDTLVQHQLDQILLFSRFRPELNFGRPADGGRVLLSFSEVRVHG